MNPIDAYDFAWTHARRNPDGSVVESDLAALVAEQVDFDVEDAKLGLARRIIARRKRPGQTAPEGFVVIPGLDLDPHAYEPHRLVADDEGNVVENRAARPRFKDAEATRARESARKAVDRATRESAEADTFAGWVAEQTASGRDPRDLTWEACIRETGLWKEPDVEVSEPDHDESEA